MKTIKGVKIVSCYDGMACGMLAFIEAGIPVERYVAYEIDKYAIKTVTHNFPMIEEKGDVFKADFTEYEGFDFVIGGSPCTYWSIAQKNNRETEASGLGWELFQQYVRAIKEVKPKYFIYENNKSMSEAIRKSICEAFGFEQVLINSALVSAQNRQRYYWVGKRNEDGTYSKVNVEQPEDRGILLKDILEDGIVDRDKAYCCKHQAGNARDYFKKHHTQVKFEPVRILPYGDDTKARPINTHYSNNSGTGEGSLQQRMFSDNKSKQQVNLIAEPVGTSNGKAYCLSASYAKCSGEKIGNYAAHTLTKKCKSMVAEPVNVTADGKSHTIKAQYFKNGIPTKAISKADGKTYTVYEVKDGQITIKDKQYPIKLVDGYYIIRKLTVKECMRLQTVPEFYEFPVSDTQAYKMLGNGWTVSVIAHLINNIYNEVEPECEQIKFF